MNLPDCAWCGPNVGNNHFSMECPYVALVGSIRDNCVGESCSESLCCPEPLVETTNG